MKLEVLYIAGVDSYLDNGHEDRRWKFTCCSVRDLKIYSCQLTGYVSDFNQPLDFQADPEEVITGVYGYHDNGRECHMDKIYSIPWHT